MDETKVENGQLVNVSEKLAKDIEDAVWSFIGQKVSKDNACHIENAVTKVLINHGIFTIKPKANIHLNQISIDFLNK